MGATAYHRAALPSNEITFVAHEVKPTGGMERAQRELILGLLERGWRVDVISRVCDVPPHPGLTHRRVPVPARPFTLALPAFALWASVLLRVRRAPIVNALGAIVLNRVDVVTLQFCQKGYRAAGRALRPSRPGVLYRLNNDVANRLALALEAWSYRPSRVRAVAAVSDTLAGEVREHYAPIGDRVSVIPNGVDTESFRADAERRARVRGELGVGDGDLVAVFVGGDWPRKGLEIALRAVAASEGWRLLVVGGGDEQSYGELARSVGAAVTFAGLQRDPAPYFAAADAFLLPSEYEGFALVSLEAAASGLPLLLTPAVGAGPLLDGTGAGWSLPREVDAFAERLRELRDDPALRERTGAAARAAAERLRWPAIVDAYERLYAELDGR